MDQFEDKKRIDPNMHIPCILIIDDNLGSIKTQSDFFQRFGYAIETANTVEDAIGIIASRKVDLAIVDGDLGDGEYNENSLSGKFILEHLQGKISYIRSSMQGAAIPKELHGETPGEAGFDVFDRALRVLPPPEAKGE